MPSSPESNAQHPSNVADRSASAAVYAFPAFVLAGSALAWIFPEPFLPAAPYITQFLMIIMFGMGLTLTIPDLREVGKRPLPILLGVIAQFVIMPVVAIGVAQVLGLNPALAVGLLMLGSVSGGTSSNVITYLAKGDVALSVAMTSVSTLLSPIITPALMLWLAGAHTEIDAAAMSVSLTQTVLVPVFGGVVLRFLFDRWIAKISPILPWISILGIGGVLFPMVATNIERLATVGVVVIIAVVAHNVLGYVLGYVTGRVLGMPESYNRTMAVEIGSQQAGLASGMSAKFFSPEAALPGACAAVIHNITGSIFSSIFRRLQATSSVNNETE